MAAQIHYLLHVPQEWRYYRGVTCYNAICKPIAYIFLLSLILLLLANEFLNIHSLALNQLIEAQIIFWREVIRLAQQIQILN